jgi:hypothetical protein
MTNNTFRTKNGIEVLGNSRIYGSAIFGGPREFQFDPASLFANGEVGHWPAGYDPAAGQVFQLFDGTSPATAATQPVGLALDTSQGLVRGPELVTNGGFDVDAGWTKGAGWTIGGGVATFTAASGNVITQSGLTLPAGRFFEIDFELSAGISLIVQFTGGGGSDATSIITGAGQKKALLRASINRSIVGFSATGGSNGSIDAVSLRELPGNHARQFTALSRPELRQTAGGVWYLHNDGNDSLPAALPAGTYTAAWVNNLGEVTIAENVAVTTTLNTLSGQNQADALIINRALGEAERVALTRYWQARYASI